MRIKTLAMAAISLLGLAAPASAGAVTYIGSGSVAAQPVLHPQPGPDPDRKNISCKRGIARRVDR